MFEKCVELSKTFEIFYRNKRSLVTSPVFYDEGQTNSSDEVKDGAEKPVPSQNDGASVKTDSESSDNEEVEGGEKRKPSLRHRKFWPGANTSNQDFAKLFEKIFTTMTNVAATKRRLAPQSTAILAESERDFHDLKELYINKWSSNLVHVVCGALIFHDKRMGDFTIIEHVRILWISLGDRFLRAHDGQLYQFMEAMGFWKMYRGIMEEGVVYVLREYLNQAEGLYRVIKPTTWRNRESICESVEEVRVAVENKMQEK